MSRQLTLYEFLPKRRHIEEDYERETTSDSVMETITLNNECNEEVAEDETDHTHHRIHPIELMIVVVLMILLQLLSVPLVNQLAYSFL